MIRFDVPPLTGDRDIASHVSRRLEEDTEQLVTARLEKLSSGPYSSAALRTMGHPYSRRRPRPPAAPYQINVQSGLFRRSWDVKARFDGETLEVTFDNTAPYARYLFEGTSRMIPRPIRERVKREMKDWLRRYLAGVLRSLERRR